MITIFSFFLSSFFHPFFVSVIDIKHNAKDKNVEMSIRVFTDDLEATIKKNIHTNIDLSTGTTKPEVNKLVANYIQSKLQLTINDKPQTIKYIGYEIQKESVWIYVEISDIATIKKMNINCNLLYDYQTKQSNIFNVKANSTEKNYKLDYPNSTVEFSW